MVETRDPVRAVDLERAVKRPTVEALGFLGRVLDLKTGFPGYLVLVELYLKKVRGPHRIKTELCRPYRASN